MKMSYSRKLGASLASGALLLALAGCSSASGNSEGSGGNAETITISFATAQAPNSGLSLQAQAFMDEITELTDGQVQWDTYWSASLISSPDTVAAIGDGQVDMGYVAAVYDPNRLPLWGIGFVPTPGNAIGMAETQRDMFESSEEFKQEFAAANITPVLAHGIPSISWASTVDEIDSVDQLQGRSFRAPGPISQAFLSIGAEPVSLAVEEVYESLERGIIDGVAAFTVSAYVGLGLAEVGPWINKLPIGEIGNSAALFMNADKWESLPENVKEAFETAKATHYGNLAEAVTAEDIQACDDLIAAGGGVKVLSPNSAAGKIMSSDEVADKMYEVWREGARSAGRTDAEIANVEKQFRETSAKLSAETDYEPGLEICAARS